MKKRILFALVITAMLVGCGKAVEEPVSPTKEETVSVEDSSASVEVENIQKEENDDSKVFWEKAYLEYFDTFGKEYGWSDSTNFTFSFIYLDDDDIPEVFIDSGVEAGGESILTYYDGKVIENDFPRLGSQYIEKTGLVYTDTGHMDMYPLTITKLENGTFSVIGSGYSYWSLEDRQKMSEDENYPYTLTYVWEDENVTEEQYYEKVDELYDRNLSKRPENFCYYDELYNMLKTGKWLSYDHKYEFITDDVTWEEAQGICHQKGGYLATITCLDEAKTIASQLKEEGLEDYSLYIGYREPEYVDDEFLWGRWINADGSYRGIDHIGIYDFSYYNWPGYDYNNNEWDYREVDCGLVKYNSETNLIYIFLAPDELIKVSPQYAGKMGFICEYE